MNAHLDQAESYYAKSNYNAAVVEYAAILKRGTLPLESRAHYAESMALSGKNLSAVQLVKELLKEDKKALCVLRASGITFNSVGEFSKASDFFSEYLTIDRADLLASHYALESYRRAKRWNKAANLASRVLEQAPDDPEALVTEAAVLAEQKNETGARDILARLLRLEENHVAGNVLLARLEMGAGNYEKAKVHILTALTEAPRDETALLALIQLQKKRSKLLYFLLLAFWYGYVTPRKIIGSIIRINSLLFIVLVLVIFYLWLISELSLFALRIDKVLENNMPVDLKSQNAFSLPAILLILLVLFGPGLYRDYSLTYKLSPLESADRANEAGFKQCLEQEEALFNSQYDKWQEGKSTSEIIDDALLDFELRRPVRDSLRIAIASDWVACNLNPEPATVLYHYAVELAEHAKQKNFTEYFKEKLEKSRGGHSTYGAPTWLNPRINQ